MGLGGEYRHIAAPGDHIRSLGVDVLALHQQGNRLTAGIQSPVDDLGAFGNEHSLFRLKAVEQLSLRQPGVYIQPGVRKIRDLNNIGHRQHLHKFFLYLSKKLLKSQK